MLRSISAIVLSILFINGPDHLLFGQTDDKIDSHCNAMLSSIGSDDPHAFEKHFEHTTIPPSAAKDANRKLPNTVDIIAVAPVTENDYRTLFFSGENKDKQPVTHAQKDEIDRVQKTLHDEFGKTEGDRDFTKGNFKKVLQENSASYVIVIGHNTSSGMFRLLDGEMVTLDEIVAAAGADQKVVLVSCDSANRTSKKEAATISREITYDEAFQVAGHVAKYIRGAGRPVSLAEVQAETTKEVEKAGWQAKVAFFVMRALCGAGGAILVGLIIRKLDPCSNSKGNNSDCTKDKPKDKPGDGKNTKKETGAVICRPLGDLAGVSAAAISSSSSRGREPDEC